MLISCCLSSAFLNFLLKFDAMWRMQNTDCDSQPSSGDSNADSMVEPLSVIRQAFGWGVTNARNNWKNHIMAWPPWFLLQQFKYEYLYAICITNLRKLENQLHRSRTM